MVAQTQHGLIPAEQNHGIVRWGYATQAEFTAAVGFLAGDINKVAYVAETGIYHVLRNFDPITWQGLNETAGVNSVVYDPAARTLTLYFTDGTNVVGTNVGVPHYNDAELRILNTSTGDYIQFAVEAGVASQLIAIPARVSQRLNNAVLFDTSYAWQIGDLCRTVDGKIWCAIVAIAAGAAFTPSEWEEITNTNLLAYVDGQFAAQVIAWQEDIQLGLAGNLNIAAVAPTVGDDETLDYQVNSRWLDTVTGIEYLCTDAATGAAVWVPTSSSKNWLTANNGANFTVAPTGTGAGTLVAGEGATAGTATNAIVLGTNASSGGINQVVVGANSSYSVAYQGLVVGPDNVMRTNSNAIGRNNQTSAGGQTTTLVGDSNFNRSTGGNSNYHTVLIGKDCEQAAGNFSGGVAIGTGVELLGSGGIGIGGFNYSISTGSVTINGGTNGGNVSADYAVNVGTNCDSIGVGAVRLGSNNTTSGSGANGAYSISIGYKTDCDSVYGIAIGETASNDKNNSAVIGGRGGVPTVGEGGVNFPNYETSTAMKNRAGIVTGSRISTTNATPLNRTFARFAASQFITMDILVGSYEAATGEFCSRRCTVDLVTDASSIPTIVGTPVIGAANKSGVMETGVAFAVSGSGLQVQITGEAAKTILTTVGGTFSGAAL